MVDLIVKNGTIVTVNADREILWDGAMVVDNGVIVAIGATEDICRKYPEAIRVIDAQGKIVFPGLINTHNHLFQTLLKGLGDDMALSEWLTKMTYPCSAHLTQEDCYVAAKLGCIEGLHSGVTTQVDYMYAHPQPELSDGILQAFKELGIRAIYGRGFMDSGEHRGVPKAIIQTPDEVEKDCRRLFNQYHLTENGRIRIWVAPSNMWSNSGEMLTRLWNLTQEYQAGFTVHISETPFVREAAKKVHGVVDAEALAALRIVGPNVLLVHCVHLGEQDIQMIKEYDMKISHNPVSNMYLSSGVAPVNRFIAEGIPVGLGVDGAASNNSQDMIELMKITALLHKVHTLNPTSMTAEKVLEMATIDGAKTLGLDHEIGSLEIGKKADFFIFNPLLSAKAIPMHNPVSTLVYSSSQGNVETVAVDGKILLDKENICGENESALIARAQETAEKLAIRAGVQNRGAGHPWRLPAYIEG